MLKKSFSFVLLILITVGVFLIAPFSVYSTEEVPDYLSFQADMYSKKFDEIFVDAYSKSFAKTLYNEYQDDALLMAGINAWEDLHIVASPKYSFETGQINKKDFYKVILFDLFDYSKSGTLSSQVSELIGNPEDIFKTIKNERTSFALSFLKFICKENNLSKESLSTISPKDINLTADKISKLGIKFSDDVKVLSDVKKILDVAEDINKAVSLTADYLAVKELKEGTLSVLDLIINDTSNPGELRNAAQSYKECSMQGYQKVLTAMTEGATFGLTKAYENLADEVWKEVVGTIPGGTAVLLGMKGGRALCNYLFSSDKLTKAYYQLEADVLWEDAVTKALKTARNNYINNKTESNAKIYMSAVETFKDTVLIGFDYAEDLLEVAANSEANKTTNKWFGKYTECMSLINQVSSLKTSKWNNYGVFEDMVLRKYKQLYFPDYDSYNNLTSYQNKPITSIELSQKKEIKVGNEGYIFDYINVKANPDDYNDILNPTWESSDESIIQFETDYLGDRMGDFKCLKEGTCTITATQFPDIKSSITITVGEGSDNSEHDYLSDFEYKVNDDGKTATITKYKGGAKYLVIPSSIDGYKINCLGVYSFSACKSLEKVVIPNTVTSINVAAFSCCTSLSEITIPYSVISISASAFADCTGLKSVLISDSVSNIEDRAFKGCTNLKNITIPDSVINLGSGFVEGCANLKKVIIGNGVTRTIDQDEFYNCTSLESVIVGNKVSAIEYGAFKNCYSLKSIIIGDSVKTIGQYAFEYCSNLAEINIPDSVTKIGLGAFAECKNLKNVIIGDNLEELPFKAFEHCCEIEKITIGKKLRKIDVCAFNGCKKITTINIKDLSSWLKIEYDNTYGHPFSNSHSIFLNGELVKNLTIPEDINEILYGAFYNCTSLTSITIPDSVTSIGYEAFHGCTNLAGVKIPDSVTNIEGTAFYNCTSLTSVKIPNSVTSIGDAVFWGCTSLTSVIIPDSVTSIESYAFYNCTSLASVTIPDSVQSLGNGVFENCTNLSNIKLSGNLETVGSSAFYNCINLKNIDLPEKVREIGEHAFEDCESLKEIQIPDGVKIIKREVFDGCSSLINVYIPKSVEKIEYGAFYVGHYNLEVFYSGCKSDFNTIEVSDAFMSSEQSINFHSYNCETLNISVVAPSCSSEGYSEKTCTKCGTMWKENYTPALGHNYFNGVCAICGESQDWIYEVHSNAVTLKGYTGTETELTIPGTFEGFPVTRIDDGVFSNNSQLIKVRISEGVKYIGNSVFYKCSNLKSIDLPNSLEKIDEYAFYGCEKLTNIMLPKSLSFIGEKAFCSCKELTEIDIPDSVTDMRSGAFANCKNLKQATIGNGVLGIYYDAFSGCSNLESVVLGDSVSYIDTMAFESCSNLNSITFPDSLERIGNQAFSFCYSLEYINLPSSITSIGSYAFSCCENFNHIFYQGTTGQWEDINIADENSEINNATIHYDGSASINYYETIAPNCTNSGYDVYKCSFCGKEFKKNYVNTLGHDYNRTTVPPNCTKKGYTIYKCDVCGDEYYDDFTDALGHDFVDGICTMCGKSEEECTESEHPYDSIQLLESMVVIHAEDEYQIKFAAGNIDIKSISYKTDDLNIAYTTSKGIVHALSAGSTEVHITINDNIDLVLYITVLPKESSLTEPSAIESSEPVITESGTTEPTEPETINSIPVKTENPMQVLVEDVHINLKVFNQENELIFYPFSIENAVGEISYNLVSTEYEYFAVDKNTGALHINNNIKTGSYTIKVKIVATGNAFYKSKAVVKAINIYVKDNNEVPSASESTPDKPTEPTETQPVTDKPTEPFATEPTEPLTDKPTEPNTTNPIVTNPQPTENESTTPAVENPTVKKKANPVKVTVKTKTVKLKKLKKKVQKVKAITVKNAQGKVTYKLVKSGITKKIRKLVKINSKGVITIKRWEKAKKGTYIIKVKITAKGNTNYNLKTITKTVKIKIK